MKKRFGMIGMIAAALAMGSAAGMAPPPGVAQSINESNRQMIPGGSGMAYTALRRDRIPFVSGDSSRRRKVKMLRSGGIHKHFNKKKHGRNLRRKHGRAAK